MHCRLTYSVRCFAVSIYTLCQHRHYIYKSSRDWSGDSAWTYPDLAQVLPLQDRTQHKSLEELPDAVAALQRGTYWVEQTWQKILTLQFRYTCMNRWLTGYTASQACSLEPPKHQGDLHYQNTSFLTIRNRSFPWHMTLRFRLVFRRPSNSLFPGRYVLSRMFQSATILRTDSFSSPCELRWTLGSISQKYVRYDLRMRIWVAGKIQRLIVRSFEVIYTGSRQTHARSIASTRRRKYFPGQLHYF